MKKLSYLVLLSIVFVACGPSGPKEVPESWVKVEFLNPTEDTMMATLFTSEGYHLKDTVPPNSFVLDSILEGNYSLEACNLKKDTYRYLPSVENPKQWQIEDTATYVFVTDTVKKAKRLAIRFYPRTYVGGTKPYREVMNGHYVFDLTLDTMQRYAVVNMNFLYGGKAESATQAFKSQTNNGEYFIFSIIRGNKPMIMPNSVYNPYEELPKTLPTSYGVKSYLFKSYLIPQDLPREDILKYLFQNYVAALDKE